MLPAVSCAAARPEIPFPLGQFGREQLVGIAPQKSHDVIGLKTRPAFRSSFSSTARRAHRRLLHLLRRRQHLLRTVGQAVDLAGRRFS